MNAGINMKSSSIIARINKFYPWAFFLGVMTLLISFVISRELSLSTLAEGFRWRGNLIESYTFLRYAMGDRVFNNAVVGKDGWFFYTGEESVMDYQNTASLSAKKLSNFQNKLDQINVELEERGGMLLVVIPPNKSTVYSQYMPDEIPMLAQASRLDKFVEYMGRYGKTQVVDLRQPLFVASRSHIVYFKTDTHWNSMGAYYGYVEIMNALSVRFPSLTPRSLSDFELKERDPYTGDILDLMGLSGYEEPNWMLSPKYKLQTIGIDTMSSNGDLSRTSVDNNSISLLVYGDSFYDGLKSFIEPHFSNVKFVPFTLDTEIWSLDWIQRGVPDIVIIEVVERYLDTSLPKLLNN